MDKKEKGRIVAFIEAYPVKLYNIESLKAEIKSLDELCYPGGVDTSKDKVTSSNIQDTVYETVIKREKELKRLGEQLRRDEEYVALHDMAFEKLTDAEQEVIRKLYHGRRYADGKQWLLSHGYAYSTLNRIQNRALRKMYDTVSNGNIW